MDKKSKKMAIKEIEVIDNKKILESAGKTVIIELDEDDFTIQVFEASWDEDEEDFVESHSIGRFEIAEMESGDHYIQWMRLDGCAGKYLRKGIGRLALGFFKEYFGTKIYAASHDGHVRDDGSHLTEDAPAFVSKMRDEGLIEKDDLEDFDD